MPTNRSDAIRSRRTLALAGLTAAALLASVAGAPAAEPPEPVSQTFLIIGQELTGETRTVAGDGSVRTLVQAGVNGLLYDLEDHERVLAAGVVRMSITVNGDVLQEASVQFTRLGPQGFTVTVQIDPCWFEYVNDRDATAEEFGADVVARIEESRPGALEPCFKEWLAQRLALLGAKTAEPFVKGGIVLVPRS